MMNDTTVNDGAKNVTTWEIYEIQLNTETEKFVASKLEGMRAHAGASYSCVVGFTTELTGDANNTASLTMAKMRVEYGTGVSPITNDTVFLKAESCAADMEQSLLVPIIVACALAGLVLAICVAYIIGRRRTYSGYSAM
jgi:hypothetical protein